MIDHEDIKYDIGTDKYTYLGRTFKLSNTRQRVFECIGVDCGTIWIATIGDRTAQEAIAHAINCE